MEMVAAMVLFGTKESVAERSRRGRAVRAVAPPRRILSTALMPGGRGVRVRTSGKTCSHDRRGGNGPHDDDIHEPAR